MLFQILNLHRYDAGAVMGGGVDVPQTEGRRAPSGGDSEEMDGAAGGMSWLRIGVIAVAVGAAAGAGRSMFLRRQRRVRRLERIDK